MICKRLDEIINRLKTKCRRLVFGKALKLNEIISYVFLSTSMMQFIQEHAKLLLKQKTCRASRFNWDS